MLAQKLSIFVPIYSLCSGFKFVYEFESSLLILWGEIFFSSVISKSESVGISLVSLEAATSCALYVYAGHSGPVCWYAANLV